MRDYRVTLRGRDGTTVESQTVRSVGLVGQAVTSLSIKAGEIGGTVEVEPL